MTTTPPLPRASDQAAELLPCPICGGQAHTMQEDHPDVWWVGCMPGGCVATDTHPDLADAVAVWNRRAAIAHSAAQAPGGERDDPTMAMLTAMVGFAEDRGVRMTTVDAKAIYKAAMRAADTPAAPTCTPADERALSDCLNALRTAWHISGVVQGRTDIAASIARAEVDLARAAQGAGTAPVGAGNVIEMLLDITRLAHDAMDGTEENEHGLVWDRANFDALSAAMDKLEELPDDQPGYVMGPAAKAAWALQRATHPATVSTAAAPADSKSEFLAHIRKSSAIVASWPSWKQSMYAPTCKPPELKQVAPEVRAGYKLVPLRPTPRMMLAGFDAIRATPKHQTRRMSMGEAYCAMLDAAPTCKPAQAGHQLMPTEATPEIARAIRTAFQDASATPATIYAAVLGAVPAPVAAPEAPTADPDGDFAKGMLIQLARMGATPAGLSLAAQLFGVGPCEKCGYRKLHCRCAAPEAPATEQQAATTASASERHKPIAYAIFGINVSGKHYLRDVKPIPVEDAIEEWKSDDDGLGEFWAGNEPLAPSRAADGQQGTAVATALRELMSIVKIHSEATGENFAWAEMAHAQEVLDGRTPADGQQGASRAALDDLETFPSPHGTLIRLADAKCRFAAIARASLPTRWSRADFIESIVLGVAEIPDRNSPDDQPEMMLVSDAELRAIVQGAFERADEDDDSAPLRAQGIVLTEQEARALNYFIPKKWIAWRKTAEMFLSGNEVDELERKLAAQSRAQSDTTGGSDEQE